MVTLGRLWNERMWNEYIERKEIDKINQFRKKTTKKLNNQNTGKRKNERKKRGKVIRNDLKKKEKE